MQVSAARLQRSVTVQARQSGKRAVESAKRGSHCCDPMLGRTQPGRTPLSLCDHRVTGNLAAVLAPSMRTVIFESAKNLDHAHVTPRSRRGRRIRQAGRRRQRRRLPRQCAGVCRGSSRLHPFARDGALPPPRCVQCCGPRSSCCWSYRLAADWTNALLMSSRHAASSHMA